jgi:hypothetical protein
MRRLAENLSNNSLANSNTMPIPDFLDAELSVRGQDWLEAFEPRINSNYLERLSSYVVLCHAVLLILKALR